MQTARIRPAAYYRTLTRNLVLFVVVISLLPLFLTGAIILHQFKQAYQTKVEENLEVLLNKHRRTIDAFLIDRLADIRVLARSYTVPELQDPAFLKAKLGLLREEYNGVYVDLGLVDAKGAQVAYAGPYNLAGANYSTAQWFRQASKSEHFVSNVFAGLRGSPHFIVAAKKRYQGRDWLLKATIDFESFNALVENIRIGETGFAFILNRQSEFQTKPRQEVILASGAWRQLLQEPLDPGRVTIVERPDSLGQAMIYAAAPLKKGQWIICAQQEVSDAFVHLVQAQRAAIAIFVIGGLLIVVATLILARRLVRRIAEADEQKESMNEKMIEAGRLASIGELAAGIAHEINNPVAIMVEEAGWIEDLMSDEGPMSEETLSEIQRAVQQIQEQGERCKQITHKLLSFARKTDPTIKPVDINGLVGEVLGLVGQKSRYAGVKLTTALDKDLPRVAASPSELQQVLLNLVNNAVDAISSEGGTVKVTTSLENGAVRMSVSDTGIGIADANLARIFDPFYTTKPVGQGTGLGLSICYGIINKLGGEITVTSAKGKGSTFTVILPARQDSNPATTGAPRAGQA
ncbi:MAG: two-component sensor histidine kinase [Desulfarculaceae bacterium]|nr:two-component sensor histidine kinase [Desulfarculaceae bacterium]MCF8048834.1 two-component sensor histidine kinase [Desulfarculaceae bacterium]MCF8066155.1 two-component sensor histidine kinase [Desulfarculaceae bacterium]MCF8099644.1 two-component sensor histidine kinase [Desulfarculaceae bacterium]MCF8122008.1 two-component sensor histidine kinase [Desulfarculaceae bacterium]